MAQEDSAALIEGLPIQSAPQRASIALPRLRTANRRQVALRAVDLESLVADEHRVRLVWSFVERLDLAALYSTIKAVEGQPGHPPADPRILLALWLYATAQGIGSAGELARLGTEQSKQIYKERAATAECCNAQARNRGLRQFVVRGLDKVRNIAVWHALTHNMVCGWRLAAG